MSCYYYCFDTNTDGDDYDDNDSSDWNTDYYYRNIIEVWFILF